jgi:DNA-binding IscR family transcriptional regulator
LKKNKALIPFNLKTKMKKLILLVAIATTISFVACTNKATAEETAIENATEAIEEATEEIEQATEEVLDEVTVD